MSDAVIGLIGAIVGAGISTGANVLLEERRFKRNEGADQKREERELLRAARLIEDELTDVLLTLVAAVDQYVWWAVPVQTLPTERWAEFGPVLAKAEGTATDYWRWISHCYQVIRDLNAHQAALVQAHGALQPFDADSDRRLRVVINEVYGGIETVQHFTGNSIRRGGPDDIAATARAAETAAVALAPGVLEPGWLKHENYYEAKLDVEALGVTLAKAPDFEQFEVSLPVGTRIRVTEASVREVTSALHVAGVLGDAKQHIPSHVSERLPAPEEETVVMYVLLDEVTGSSERWMHLGDRLPNPPQDR